MSHSYSQNNVHLVFSTKGRAKMITPELRGKLLAYMAGICRKEGMFVHVLGGTADHVHLLLQLSATHSVANAVLTIKSNSSCWARRTQPDFAWQEGYASFSVSASVLAAVRRYIENQEQHHRKKSFEEEYLGLLRKHGIPYDTQFVFG
jgi:putative transposase